VAGTLLIDGRVDRKPTQYKISYVLVPGTGGTTVRYCTQLFRTIPKRAPLLVSSPCRGRGACEFQ
jgi:hypothetical protein